MDAHLRMLLVDSHGRFLGVAGVLRAAFRFLAAASTDCRKLTERGEESSVGLIIHLNVNDVDPTMPCLPDFPRGWPACRAHGACERGQCVGILRSTRLDRRSGAKCNVLSVYPATCAKNV